MASRILIALATGIAVFGATACSSNKGSTAKADLQEGIGVNGYLWRAALDTVSFMPLASADPWGGVINTEWFSNPEKPDERFKLTVYILDQRLRADGVSVAVSREALTENGWATAATTPDTGIAIENAILTRARQLRLAALD